MSDYGLSIIFGRPFPTEFVDWGRRLPKTSYVRWHEAENLHATVVNCTPPIGRSVPSVEEALSSKSALYAKFRGGLVSLLQGFPRIRLRFSPVRAAGSSVILQSETDDEIGRLKRALQGGHDVISEDQARSMLQSGEVTGVDKFSTSKGSLQPMVAVTLGKLTGDRQGLPPLPHAPELDVEGVRIVLYRDRDLRDADASQVLVFGGTEESNGAKMDEWFERLG
jgi:hypothetical protein